MTTQKNALILGALKQYMHFNGDKWFEVVFIIQINKHFHLPSTKVCSMKMITKSMGFVLNTKMIVCPQ